ncbi:MAG: sulfatase [Planctomycetaceae bacterium]
MSPLRRALLLLPFLAVSALLILWRVPGAMKTPPPNDRPNVLIVTLDTVRADAAGRDRGTPAIAEFLQEATSYPRARTPLPLTVPALLSLFSGLLPARHGVHDNSGVLLPGQRGFPLLAEEFRDAGYDTAGFTPVGVTGRHTSLDAGFLEFDGYTGTGGPAPYLQAEERVKAPLAWLASRTGKRPFFCWVHFYDPHSPYLPYPGDDRRAGTKAGDSAREIYFGEIRRTDAVFERLLAAAGKDAIVVLASDHGEGLGEHGEPEHGYFAYSSTLDILLAVRAPGLAAGAEEAAPRTLCDLAPTLRALCGLPPRESDGRSLLGPPLPVAVSECIFLWRAHGWGQCLTAFDGRYSLVEAGPRVELFDRQSDPGETHPLDAAGHPAYAQLDRALDALRLLGARGRDREFLPRSETPYAVASRPVSNLLARPENANLLDPTSRAALLARLEAISARAQAALLRRDSQALVGLVVELEEIAALAPESPAPIYLIAEAQRTLGDLLSSREWRRSAARSARESVERGYVVSSPVQLALEASRAAGDPEECRLSFLLLARPGLVPDLACLEAGVEVAHVLHVGGDATAHPRIRALLERGLGYLADPESQARLRGWISSLDAP